MAVTDNNGSTYYNLNQCRSFNVTLAGLEALTDQPCSEVIVVNRSGGSVSLYDGGYSAAENAFLLGDQESVTLRGLTNSNQVSANGTGTIYYRTQYFSNNPSR